MDFSSRVTGCKKFSCNSTYVHNWKQCLLKFCLIFLLNGSGGKGLLGPSNKVRKLKEMQSVWFYQWCYGGGQLLIFLQVIYSTARHPSRP
jgi:hypothetical protein